MYGNPNGIHSTVINSNSSNPIPVVLLNPHVFTVFILVRNKINISKTYNTISKIVAMLNILLCGLWRYFQILKMNENYKWIKALALTQTLEANDKLCTIYKN